MGIATDPDHTARAVTLARIALGSQGIRVGPADLPTPSSAERRKLFRDALRLTLWQAPGPPSPGLFLVRWPANGRIVGFRRGSLVNAA